MEIDLKKLKKVHLGGIGGIGMSALARMFLDFGKEVTGSDRSLSEITDKLSEQGVKIFKEESSSNIEEDIDLFVYTPALFEDHPELQEVQKKNIPALSYPEVLGLISKEMYTVAVSGSHGKTTTTAMIAHILKKTGLDPMVIVGSLLKGEGDGSEGSNYISGKGEIFVVEACEYKRSFLHLHPKVLVITNIAEEHLDCYQDLRDIQSAFEELVSRLPEDGALVCSPEESSIKPVLERSKAKVIDSMSQRLEKGELHIYGEHNRRNAESAISTAIFLGIDRKEAERSLSSFAGTWRRFDFRGETVRGSLVFDDYAHHPDEISATISLARERFPDKKIVVVFQPHLHSRTDCFFDGFVESLSQADRIFVAPIYQAREEKGKKVHSSIDIVEKIAEDGKTATFIDSLDKVASEVPGKCNPEDVVIMMGAGDIYTVTEKLISG